MIKKRLCELCLKTEMWSEFHTVCDKCDDAMAAEFEAIDRVKATAWAAKYKCRRCGDGLSLNRYFNCEVCLNDMESDSGFDDMDVQHFTRAEQKSKLRVRNTPAEKPCNKCKEVKPIAKFCVQKRNLDGHMNTCNVCRGARNKELTKLRLERLANQAAAS